MNKFFYFLLSAAMLCILASCEPKNDPVNPDPEDPEEETPAYLDTTKASSMVVYLGGLPVLADTAINVTDAEMDAFSGSMLMGVRGSVDAQDGFRVTATRSEANQQDELCAGVQCMPGDGELVQDFDFVLPSGTTSAQWYTHYTPAKEGDYTVAYKFQNYNKQLTITVHYIYSAAE